MRRLTALTATLAAIASLAACSDDSDTSGSADGATDTPSADVSTTAASDFTVVGDPYLTGPGRWAMTALGDPEADLAVFDVPADFQGHQQWIWFDGGDEDFGEDFGQLMYLAPTAVPQDPCAPNRPSLALGDGVEALAAALADQRLTTTTRPVEVSLGGHDGLYLELTTPSRGCSADTGHLVMWAGPDDGRELDERSTDRYWILDVDGHRVVLSAMTPTNSTPAAVRRVRGMVESVTFTPAT